MMERMIRLEMAHIEAVNLRRLVEDLTGLLAVDDPTDPALARLTPSAYPGDEHASAEFAALTRTDLLGRRATDARAMLDGLAPVADLDDEADAMAQVTVDITAAHVDSWLRTLAALRVIIADRLGVIDDDDHDDDDDRFGVYDWLGFRLDSLVALADALDEYAEDPPTDD
ncbi:DUF2017 family protein [uncultured Microbacterium sp.]|uniref:DUF2017 family protein n=1 Tax=uncultured Microbacterium sp. TaxID=191216 RepID=UPI0026281CC8|nr:DUF2017 family protein [uncultured Microbacterium sp.]